MRAIGTRQQNAGLASTGTNHDPALRPTVVGQRLRVLHQLKLQHVNEEPDGGVIVAHDQCDKGEMRHRAGYGSFAPPGTAAFPGGMNWM